MPYRGPIISPTSGAIDTFNTPCANNLLGIKGLAVQEQFGVYEGNFGLARDALQITHIDMPATPLEIFNVKKKTNPKNGK